MKKQEIFDLMYQLAAPVALMLVGLVLIFAPDTASVLISRLLGWCLTLAGIFTGIWAIFSGNKVGKGIMAVGLVCIGGFLSANPLVLAAFIGRIIGVLIALRGLRELFLCRSRGHGQTLALVLTVAGIVLILLPLTTSRIVFSLCGAVVLVLGVLMLLDRLKDVRRLPKGKDDIIDAL